MNQVDAETKALIDAFNILRHRESCYHTDVLFKGKYCEEKWLRTLDELGDARQKLKDKLLITGPVLYEDNVWSGDSL